MELRDEDLYDYAKAERVFPECTSARVRLRLMPMQADRGQLDIELCDGRGASPSAAG
ncbi:hypothetical protein N6H14_28350 [Paenibacillus sp. CC-CFT747]|nr:hypothetical protein N6H14_28350 [Paenibacillus sp. CC-CFT747]